MTCIYHEVFMFTDVPVDEEFEKQTAMETPPTSFKTKIGRTRAKRKKREIRVFVSSTFRDFAKEREEIIKKAFREVGTPAAFLNMFKYNTWKYA